MSEKLREALSAAVDGEASEFELRRVFDEMAKDDSLARAWQSYHLIKQAAQGENVQGVSEMGERIWASLDAEEFLEQDIVQEEPAAEAVVEEPKRRWGLAGGAMAAALALVVVFTGGLLDTDETGSDVAAPNQIVLVPVDPVNSQAANGVVPVSLGATTVADLGDADLGDADLGEDFDYGPGFVPYSELSAADQARSDGYFLHHVQHQAVNGDNVLSFVKMISYPQ